MIPNSSPHRILLVDNQPASLVDLRRRLEDRGHQVESVEGVLYAMWAVNASRRVYDLVICALDLTDGDALDLLAHLRRRMNVRTIALTHPAADLTTRRGAEASRAVDRVLLHPGVIRPSDPACERLCEAVAELLPPARPDTIPENVVTATDRPNRVA